MVMVNKQIAAKFNLLASLMELYGENAFKTKAYSNAYVTIRKWERPLSEMSPAEIGEIPGIGASVRDKIIELLEKGSLKALDVYTSKTPEGIQQLLGIKGLGPKKVKTIWEALKIESPAELLYACEENRLVALPGFGFKTQEDLRIKISYFLESRDRYLYGQIESEVLSMVQKIEDKFPGHQIATAGDFATLNPVVDKIELVISPPITDTTFSSLSGTHFDGIKDSNGFHFIWEERFTVFVRSVKSESFGSVWAGLTLSEEWQKVITPEVINALKKPSLSETPWSGLPNEWMDRVDALSIAKNDWQNLIGIDQIKGVLHNHSTWSDGLHILSEMADNVVKRGYEYFLITDHSQSAFYANGLLPERVTKQWTEIDELNRKNPSFRVFKGIESDIKGDGELDYDDEILKGFDCVIASIHSNLKMDIDKATSRLIKAIENPYTRILGHPTGRLLLARPGYPIDYKKVIDACAANNVAIELNANPLRLDLDFSWIGYCMEKEVMISINPDAHSTGQLDYIRYGTIAARKGGLTKDKCLNAKTLPEFEEWLKSK